MTTDPTVQPRRRAAHLGPERRRPQVLDAALAIAVEQGIGAVTMAAVADRMKVTRPVVYSCFADRVELLHELIAREERRIIDGVLEATPRRAVDAGEGVFVDGFQALLRVVAANPDSWRLAYGNPDPDVATSFGHGRDLVLARCTELLRPTLHAWGTTEADTKLPVLVELWISAGESAVRSLLADESSWTPETLGAFVGAAVYRALRDA
ncbi:TetR/AcrR family transcriptional regulator [Nocardia sp. AG03]|uniref:TetR/AcrR family transcriptional regulator n=1 Tax=Nocardia sp. AG03 TaxID=3025312 RepID=UPI0024184AF7|nr:TetR/AcrR family transcriptional regulator [Nocardia sp. AG03]